MDNSVKSPAWTSSAAGEEGRESIAALDHLVDYQDRTIGTLS